MISLLLNPLSMHSSILLIQVAPVIVIVYIGDAINVLLNEREVNCKSKFMSE